MQYLTVGMPVRLWQRVDGCVDNSMAVDAVDVNIESVIAGSCVRDAGWRASAACSGQQDELGWPPPEHLLSITLRRPHWDWVLSQLARWEPFETDGVAADVRDLIADAIRSA